MPVSSKVPFTGNVTHKLDAKSRVAVPASWQAAQGQTLVMLEAISDGYNILKYFTQEVFEEKMEEIHRYAESHGYTPGQADAYVGHITGCCFDAEVSSQGKLLIPKQQRERIGLEEKAVLVGRGRHFEIWKPEDFAATLSREKLLQNALDKEFCILHS